MTNTEAIAIVKSHLEDLLKLSERATPGPLSSFGSYADLRGGAVRRIYRDEQGRRCTQFLAVCNSANAPNATNAEMFAKSMNESPIYATALLKVCIFVGEFHGSDQYECDCITCTAIREAAEALEKLK